MAVRTLSLLVVGLAACTGEPSGPSNVTAPPRSEFDAARVNAEPSDSHEIDLDSCKRQQMSFALPLGSAWALVHARSSDLCEVWLGGETEDPLYNGHPTQYCQFYRSGTLTLDTDQGGPFHLDYTWCVNP